MASFTQLHDDMRSASMRPVATLTLSPDELAHRWNLHMARGHGNLGENLGALLQTEPDHRQFALLHHLDGPPETFGVELLAPEQDDPADALRHFLNAFELTDAVVAWAPGDSRRLRAV